MEGQFIAIGYGNPRQLLLYQFCRYGICSQNPCCYRKQNILRYLLRSTRTLAFGVVGTADPNRTLRHYFPAVLLTAIGAGHHTRQWICAFLLSGTKAACSTLPFLLYRQKGFMVDNCLMAVFYMELRELTRILHFPLRQMVFTECLLQYEIPGIGVVVENTKNCRLTPLFIKE